jgi:nicotinic acid phosphoribosyltransferase
VPDSDPDVEGLFEVAKISDSPGKTLCRDADFIRNLKQAFHVGV